MSIIHFPLKIFHYHVRIKLMQYTDVRSTSLGYFNAISDSKLLPDCINCTTTSIIRRLHVATLGSDGVHWSPIRHFRVISRGRTWEQFYAIVRSNSPRMCQCASCP